MPTRRLPSRLGAGVCLTFVLAACDSGSGDEDTTDSIGGHSSLPAGLNGTVANAAFEIYGSLSDYDDGAAPIRTVAADQDGRSSVNWLNPSNYFFLAHRNNNDNSFTSIDFCGFSGGLGSPSNVESLQLSVTR